MKSAGSSKQASRRPRFRLEHAAAFFVVAAVLFFGYSVIQASFGSSASFGSGVGIGSSSRREMVRVGAGDSSAGAKLAATSPAVVAAQSPCPEAPEKAATTTTVLVTKLVYGSTVQNPRAYHVVTTAAGFSNHWQARVHYYWFKKQRDACLREPSCDMGGFTRVLHSGKPDDLMDEVPTVVVDPLPPSVSKNTTYIVLNRPYAFLEWINRVSIPEEVDYQGSPFYLLHLTYPCRYDKFGNMTDNATNAVWTFDKREYSVRPPPRNLPMPPAFVQNNLVRLIIGMLNEATDNLPCWDDYRETSKVSKCSHYTQKVEDTSIVTATKTTTCLCLCNPHPQAPASCSYAAAPGSMPPPPSSSSAAAAGCPVAGASADPTGSGALNPRNNIPASLAASAASSSAPGLSGERVVSSIPMTPPDKLPGHQQPGQQHWVYPSERMFYNAMQRKARGALIAAYLEHSDSLGQDLESDWALVGEYRAMGMEQSVQEALVRQHAPPRGRSKRSTCTDLGWDPQADDMHSVVSIHNAVNERAWNEVMAWERLHCDRCPNPRLKKFQGRPSDLSPKARLLNFVVRGVRVHQKSSGHQALDPPGSEEALASAGARLRAAGGGMAQAPSAQPASGSSGSAWGARSARRSSSEAMVGK
ncbi:putative cytochrome c-type heme lyase [Tetrabaena socialis]|uniref:Holocytochrome c-type synthase n=1 Tax=Tetrabaena socialis TaxID=47790 RepID=A0A2J7ZSN2_9CHLO|nr:putative cytochrome c-type heme lyase [Tetrabaena socialis]|eukprot:PNH03274.1 putative cytochrome c-type heme lyase [Tetrabaena socialis]